VVEGEEREEVDEDDATFTRGEDSTNQGRKKSSDYVCYERKLIMFSEWGVAKYRKKVFRSCIGLNTDLDLDLDPVPDP
jgi:hypothetical protein